MENPWLFALLLLSVLVRPLSGQDREFPGTSGNAFVRLCSAIDKDDPTSREMLTVTSCLGYVSGFREGVAFERAYVEGKVKQEPPAPFCIPESVENGQMVRIVLKQIGDNPADAHLQTSLLIMDALGNAYPCPSKVTNR